jgi:DNA-binding transcriptional MerR regulator
VNKLPSIPDKKYFSISEVSDLCKVKTHTLRFWEKEFDILKPSTRKGSRRVYQREDILIVRTIRSLLYEEGLTISGAKKKISSKESRKESLSNDQLVDDLEEILKEIKQVV